MFQNVLNIAAATAAVLYALFVISRKERDRSSYALFGFLLLISALQTVEFLMVLRPEQFPFYRRLLLVLEAAIPAGFLLFSVTFRRREALGSVGLLQKAALAASPLFIAAALTASLDAFYYAPDFGFEMMLFLGTPGFVFYLGLLLFLVISLVNLERTYLSAATKERWRIKFDIIGVGLIAAVYIYYYSQGLLYRTINTNLLPLKSVILLAAIGLVAYAQVKRGSVVQLSVSKQMAYRSVVILAVGFYLILLGLLGEGIRYFGKGAQNVFFMAIAFLGGAGILAVLLSEDMKRKIRVSIHKHFYANKYDYRQQWLQFTDRISSGRTADEVMRSILVFFSDTFGMGGAALFLRDAEGRRYDLAAQYSMYLEHSLEQTNSLIAYLENEKKVFHVSDNIRQVLDGNQEIFEAGKAWFVIPLFSNGTVEGCIVLASPYNRHELYTYEDFDLMKTLARQATAVLRNLRLSDDLSRAKEMEAAGRVSAFVAHDLKNLAATLSLVTENAHHYMDDPEFRKDMIESVAATAEKMKVLINRLKDLREKPALSKMTAELSGLVVGTVSGLNRPDVKLTCAAAYADVDAEEMGKVVLNLVLNGVEATNGKGVVTVETGCEDMAFIRVRDEGPGMTEEFMRDHLFRPFRTTKKKGLGIGLYQCRQIVEAHGGRIEVESGNGAGTVFTVLLPPVAFEASPRDGKGQ